MLFANVLKASSQAHPSMLLTAAMLVAVGTLFGMLAIASAEDTAEIKTERRVGYGYGDIDELDDDTERTGQYGNIRFGRTGLGYGTGHSYGAYGLGARRDARYGGYGGYGYGRGYGYGNAGYGVGVAGWDRDYGYGSGYGLNNGYGYGGRSSYGYNSRPLGGDFLGRGSFGYGQRSYGYAGLEGW